MLIGVREGSVWEGLVVSGVVVGREDYWEGICDGREARPMAELGGAGSGFDCRCRAKYLTSIV